MLSLIHLSALALVALASFSSGSPLGRPRMEAVGQTLLGYRTVDKTEATSINKNQELVYHKAFDNPQQLGLGKSLSGGVGQWDVGEDNWYCFVMMPSAQLKSIKKIWIPQDQFFNSESTIVSYIKSKGLDPKETLRFGEVQHKGKDFDELFIPSAVIQASDDIYAECYESMAELTAAMKEMGESPLPTVDYTTGTFAGPKH